MIKESIDSEKTGLKNSENSSADSYLVLDIEVIPIKHEQPEITEYLMDKNFPRRMHPMFSRILIIGLKKPNGPTELLYYKDEKELLTNFWSRIQMLKPSLLVTFNGYNFDIPFLEIRSKINNVKPTMGINHNKWRADNSNHFDCMQVLSSNQTFLNVALDISCQVFGIPIPEKRYYGDDVHKLFKTGDMESIKEHCQQDVELTEKLFFKLK